MDKYEQTLECVKKIISKTFGIDERSIHAESKLYENLGLNSLDRADLLFEIEERLGVALYDHYDTIHELVQDIIEAENEKEMD